MRKRLMMPAARSQTYRELLSHIEQLRQMERMICATVGTPHCDSVQRLVVGLLAEIAILEGLVGDR